MDNGNLVVQGFRMPTPTRSLIEAHLKARSLDGLVSTARRKGASWQAIADEIRGLTGVIVSRETLRIWYPQHQTGSAARPVKTDSAA